MRLSLAGLALLVGCGGAQHAPPSEPVSVHAHADATVGELLSALDQALSARGHEGECFLAWDAARTDVEVQLGDRTYHAALGCGGLTGLADALEGRCPAARGYYVEPGEAMRTRGMLLYFAAPGAAFADAPTYVAGIDGPAAALFDSPEGARAVLGVPLTSTEANRPAGKQDERAPSAAPSERPLDDPRAQSALQRLVRRIQRCQPEGEGSLVLAWRALPDGTITDAQVVTSTVPAEVAQCALNIATATSLPEREGEPVEYCAPVLLSPSLRPR